MRSIWLAVMAAAALFAQADPPARVGRLNYIAGSVSLRPGGVEDWVPAEINRPLTMGDHLWVEEGSRAELHVGGVGIRLNGGTGMSFLNLDDRAVQISLTEGSFEVRLRRLDDDETFEIDTPNLAFTLLRPGEYRVDVTPGGDSTIAMVRAGDAEVSGGGQAFTVHARQQAIVNGGDNGTYDVTALNPRDAFDDWCAQRDRREDTAVSSRYVSRETTGYEDLDDYGDWSPTGDYGAVWVPRNVPVDWAPYHDGHWVWMDPWGWTWVDDAPWGFAPFHYGRWVYWGARWAWVPGPVAMRPVYSPALVAWVGGSNWGISVGVGGGRPVGWFPLGPREPYVPAYRVSQRYVTQVNVNITNVNATNVVYVNRNAPGAMTVVSQEAMARSRAVRGAAIRVNGGDLRAAAVVGVAPVAPMRESVIGVRGGAPVSRPPERVVTREVVARRTPPPPPVSFAARQQALQADPGRPMAQSEAERYRRAESQSRPLVRQAPPAQVREVRPGVTPAMRDDGGRQPDWNRRPNQPAPQQPVQQPQVDRSNEVRTPDYRPQRPEVRRPVEQPRPLEQQVERPRPVEQQVERSRPVEQPRQVEPPREQRREPAKKDEKKERKEPPKP